MKTSICIDMMYSYCSFYERFDEVKKSGINTIEFWKWSNKDINAIAKSGLNVSIFNIDSIDEKLSYDLSRGIINDGRTEDFIKALNESIPIYKKLNASAMIVLIGENAPFNRNNVCRCLNYALPILKNNNVNLVIEPLNNIDRKGYSMPYSSPIFDILKELNSENIKMLYDIYHQNMMNDFSIDEICKIISLIGHFHIADAPGRHQPGTGAIDYIPILRKINELPYDGYIGLEYRSTIKDNETFEFLRGV